MSDGMFAFITAYCAIGVIVAAIRRIEFDDTNLLRVFLFGVVGPVVVLVVTVRVVGRYLRHRLPVELAELLPRVPDKRLTSQTKEETREYEAGQWRN